MAQGKKRLGQDLRAQAAAIRRAAKIGTVSVDAQGLVVQAAESLEAVARSKERKPPPAQSVVLHLSEDASTTEVRQARRHRPVRRGEDVFLPSWQEAAFGLPNALIRSALFSVGALTEENSKESVMDASIAAQGDTVLKLTGRRLIDYDRHVFATLLSYYSTDRALSSNSTSPWVRVSFWQFTQAMGLAYGVNVHKAVRASLIRLNAAHLRVRVMRREIPLPCLVEVGFEDGYTEETTVDANLKGSDIIAFRVPEGMAELFGYASWTAVPAAALTNYSGLIRWLATFYSTHSKPFPLKVEDLYDYSGSTCGLPEFRRRLKNALAKLESPATPDGIRVECTLFDKVTDKVEVFLARWNELKTK